MGQRFYEKKINPREIFSKIAALLRLNQGSRGLRG